MPKLSVLIPTYNRAHFLPETLDSVLGQTFRDLEVLVVDNASSDGTAELMESYVSRDPRVKYIRKPVNKGVMDSYRLGLQNSSGEYQAFLDSDDTMLPNRLEKQVKILDQRPDVSLVFTGYYYTDAQGRKLRKSPIYPDHNHLDQLLLSCFIQWNTIVMRRTALNATGPFDDSLSHSWDWDFLLRMLLGGSKFVGIQEPLNTYRMHPNNLTRNTANEESALHQILHKAFADPRLPASARSLQDRAIAAVSLWLASGYYRGQQWDDAKRNLSKAWSLVPEWHTNHHLLVSELWKSALSPWVFDPSESMQNLLDHLPLELQWLENWRKPLLAAMQIGTALRHFNLGDNDQFQRHVLSALEQDRNLLSHCELFVELLCEEAMLNPVVPPATFIEAVLDCLPPQLDPLRKVRGRALGKVHVVDAFTEYASNRRAQVLKHVLAAARYEPSLLANRGVMSIFIRSLPFAMTGG